jgi:hypothetical protein
MNIKKLIVYFVTVFGVTLIVSIIVTLLFNLILHGANTIDWDTSIRFATVFGITFSWLGNEGTRRMRAPLSNLCRGRTVSVPERN